MPAQELVEASQVVQTARKPFRLVVRDARHLGCMVLLERLGVLHLRTRFWADRLDHPIRCLVDQVEAAQTARVRQALEPAAVVPGPMSWAQVSTVERVPALEQELAARLQRQRLERRLANQHFSI